MIISNIIQFIKYHKLSFRKDHETQMEKKNTPSLDILTQKCWPRLLTVENEGRCRQCLQNEPFLFWGKKANKTNVRAGQTVFLAQWHDVGVHYLPFFLWAVFLKFLLACLDSNRLSIICIANIFLQLTKFFGN